MDMRNAIQKRAAEAAVDWQTDRFMPGVQTATINGKAMEIRSAQGGAHWEVNDLDRSTPVGQTPRPVAVAQSEAEAKAKAVEYAS